MGEAVPRDCGRPHKCCLLAGLRLGRGALASTCRSSDLISFGASFLPVRVPVCSDVLRVQCSANLGHTGSSLAFAVVLLCGSVRFATHVVDHSKMLSQR